MIISICLCHGAAINNMLAILSLTYKIMLRMPIVKMLVISIFYCQSLIQHAVILCYWLIFWKTFSSRIKEWKHVIVYLIFVIKLIFYVDIQLSFLENIYKTLTELFIHWKTFLKKCLEMGNNQLNCGDHFHFISDACRWR